MHTFELQFEDYALPPESLIGAEGRGFYLQMEGFSVGRLQTAARATGVTQAAYEDAVAYTEGRTVFGRRVAGLQLPQAMLGRIAARLDASRRLAYHAALLMDRGEGQMEASLAKLYASRNAELATRDAMQLFGGMGYGEETEVSRHFVDARVLTIFEGAEEVLALRVIAKALLEGRDD
jgi:(2S)-methylsuccinyl-CoA dehydrogenase